MRFRNALIAFALASTSLFALAAQPASAKSISHIPATCSLGTAGYGVFMEQGADVTLGFGATGAGSSGRWHILIAEDPSAPIVDYTFDAGPAWTVSTNRTLAGGFHVIQATADNLTTGESCATQFAFRVGGGGSGTTAIGQPDVVATGSASSNSPAAGAPFTYTFRVKNSGSAPDSGVVLTDVLPIEITSVQAATVSDGTTCTTSVVAGSPTTVTCSLGALAVGVEKTVTIAVTAPTAAGTYVSTATATTTDVDANPANNVASISVTVR